MLHTTTGIIEDLFTCSIISNQAEIIKISICFETLERLNISNQSNMIFLKADLFRREVMDTHSIKPCLQ